MRDLGRIAVRKGARPPARLPSTHRSPARQWAPTQPLDVRVYAPVPASIYMCIYTDLYMYMY